MKKKKNKMNYYIIGSIVLFIVLVIGVVSLFINYSSQKQDISLTKVIEKENIVYSGPVSTGQIQGSICNKKTEYNKVVSSQDNLNQKLICTIDFNSPYLFSWQEYRTGMENKVVDWLGSNECVNNFLTWDIQENKRCGRQRQKDKIAVDEGQDGVYLICTMLYDDNVNYHYVWKKYTLK